MTRTARQSAGDGSTILSKCWSWIWRLALLLGFLIGLLLSPSLALAHDESGEASSAETHALDVIRPLTLQLLRLEQQLGHGAPSSRQGALTQLKQVIEDRRLALLALMETHPSAVLEVALPEAVVRSLPPELESEIERWVTREGVLEVLVSSDQELKVSRSLYTLTTDSGQRLDLHFAGEPPMLSSGARVRAHGVWLEQHLAVGGDSGSLTTLQEAALSPTTVKRVAVILLNFQNNATQPYTPDLARSVTFTSPSGANAYYQEVTFGKWTIEGKLRTDGDVFGWYTIPYDNTACSYSTWASAARTAAAADGFALSGYTNVIYAFPQTGACSWWGLGSLGGAPGSAYVNGSYQLGVVGHELGHNFNLHHASSYSCTDGSGARVTISPTCTASEYGDPFDIMGGSAKNHVSNFHKGRLNVLDPVNTLDVSVAGFYTIAPLEYASGGVQVLRVPRVVDASGTVTQYYYLEFRQPYGLYFDTFSATSSVVNGVTIRLAPPYGTLAKPLLLDATPETGGFGDAALPLGRTFQDPSTGISVTTKSVAATAAGVEIALGSMSCVPAPPNMSLSPSAQWGYPGQALSYTLALTNMNAPSCPAASFAVSASLPEGWTQSPAALSETLASGASVTRTLSVTSAASAMPGFFTITEAATNGADPSLQASSAASYNVLEPDLIPPLVEITNPADGAALSGRTVTISVSATDAGGIAKVEIFIDGVLRSTDASPPYQYTWNIRKLSAGSHAVRAVAWDAAGNSAVDDNVVTKASAAGR